jgi:ribosome-binding factor A
VPESEHKRSQRVAELLQHELASLISTELKDPRIGFVTVTEVRLSNDLRSARVYVSIYGSEEQRAESLDGLSKASGYLRHLIGPKLQMRYTPELAFFRDDSLDRADRLHALMHAIAHGATDTPDPSGTLPLDVETDRSALAHSRQVFDEQAEQKHERSSKRRRPRR